MHRGFSKGGLLMDSCTERADGLWVIGRTTRANGSTSVFMGKERRWCFIMDKNSVLKVEPGINASFKMSRKKM